MTFSCLQLLFCYGMIGLISGWLLGLLPFRHAWQTKHFIAFFVVGIIWLPIILLAFLCAPLANALRFQTDEV